MRKLAVRKFFDLLRTASFFYPQSSFLVLNVVCMVWFLRTTSYRWNQLKVIPLDSRVHTKNAFSTCSFAVVYLL